MAIFSLIRHFEVWDWVLLATVVLQTTALAYSQSARTKGMIYALPLPFTVACLAVGRPLDVTNVVGMYLLFIYMQSIRLLYERMRVPIVVAIFASVALYIALSLPLAAFVPRTETAFWTLVLGTPLVGLVLLSAMPRRREPGHRTPLPVWLKLPIIAVVVMSLMLAKHSLQGFVTLFPMVGVVGAYEARKSLYTMGRQVCIIMLTVSPLAAIAHLLQASFGLPVALAAGWLAYGTAMMSINCSRFNKPLAPDAGAVAVRVDCQVGRANRPVVG
jgi:hypothetical protein